MTTNPHHLAVETDCRLGQIYAERAQIEVKLGWHANTLRSAAGQYCDYGQKRRPWYVSRTDRTPADLTSAITVCLGLIDRHADDQYGYARDGIAGGTNIGQVRAAWDGWCNLKATDEELIRESQELQVVWAENGRWSRFFLVTSSSGHIHSSMNCSTCRPTTQFAWLPDVSGLTEVEAVTEHGPVLCSKCFPSAPVEWTLTNAQAKKLAKKES